MKYLNEFNSAGKCIFTLIIALNLELHPERTIQREEGFNDDRVLFDLPLARE